MSEADPPRSRSPLGQTPLGQTPPRVRYPPRSDTPPGEQTQAYSQRAAGTHPTGMRSCYVYFSPCQTMTLFSGGST